MEKELIELIIKIGDADKIKDDAVMIQEIGDLITRYSDERAKRAIAWYREKIAEVPRDRITEQALLEQFKKES